MNLGKVEIWIHDHIFKNESFRHMVYGAYQRVLYYLLPKAKIEGNLTKITPNDDYEYFFGYYDKNPWNERSTHILALRVRNSCVYPDSTEAAEIVAIAIADRSMAKIASTVSWNVQQGCMAQWLDDEHVIFNDFREHKYVCIVCDLRGNVANTYMMPIYALAEDKKTALTLDFSRLHRLRPGYGYANIPEKTKDALCPDEPCIWKIDLVTGNICALLKYTDLTLFHHRHEMDGAHHKVNHLMISPDGSRFMMLHRWIKDGKKHTRLLTCNIDGTGMYLLSDDGFVSHCCWKNNTQILAYLEKSTTGKGYYLLTDRTEKYERLWPDLIMDGHPSYSSDRKQVVTDTYPDRRRMQSLYVMEGDRLTRVARVFSPFKYGGDVRCDLHPRWSQNGEEICIDASFENRRGIYLVKNDTR